MTPLIYDVVFMTTTYGMRWCGRVKRESIVVKRRETKESDFLMDIFSFKFTVKTNAEPFCCKPSTFSKIRADAQLNMYWITFIYTMFFVCVLWYCIMYTCMMS
jgi:hypothetical protein